MEQKTVPEAVALALTVIAAATLSAAVFFAAGWYRSAQDRRVSLEQLSPEDRQALAGELFEITSKAYQPAWWATGIGYTLRPGREIDAWGSTFRANKLGYRSYPVPKAPGVFRILFLGDSWTYGLGVDWRDSFPIQLEELANREAETPSTIEAWSLALPGYNLINELSALEAFFDRLEPDAVVVCPTTNDNSSSHRVTPGGSSTRSGVVRDDFGDDHSVIYRLRLLNSFKFWRRWEIALAALRSSFTRLEALDLPAFLFFVGTWEESAAHRLMRDLGVRIPYAVVPKELADGAFRAPPPWKHGTPEAYRLYARLLFRMMAPTLGWRQLRAEEGDLAGVVVFTDVPAGDWRSESTALGDRTARKTLSESYRPGPGQWAACAGPMDCVTGLMGRATTVLVRRGASRALKVSLRRLEVAAAGFLYPLGVEIAIPSRGGGTKATLVVPADGPAVHRIDVPIPGDVRQGAVLDVEIRAERTTLAPTALWERSLFIDSIEPIDD